jgi:hypothetical protein
MSTYVGYALMVAAVEVSVLASADDHGLAALRTLGRRRLISYRLHGLLGFRSWRRRLHRRLYDLADVLALALSTAVDVDSLDERLSDKRRVQLKRFVTQEAEFAQTLDDDYDLRDLHLLTHADPERLAHDKPP